MRIHTPMLFKHTYSQMFVLPIFDMSIVINLNESV